MYIFCSSRFASKDKEMSKEVKKFANSLVKKMKKELGINSPSTVMRPCRLALKAGSIVLIRFLSPFPQSALTIPAISSLSISPDWHQIQYTKKVESEIKKLNKSLSKLGENAAEGFLKGFASKDKEMSKEVILDILRFFGKICKYNRSVLIFRK